MTSKSAVAAIISALDDVAKAFHDDPKGARAIERAQSWLKNITEPLTEAEKTEMETLGIREDMLEAWSDDPIDQLQDTWDSTMTDEDYKYEIQWSKDNAEDEDK